MMRFKKRLLSEFLGMDLLYLNETRRLGWHSDRCSLIGMFAVSRQTTLLLNGAY